jgi:hypothetical protein
MTLRTAVSCHKGNKFCEMGSIAERPYFDVQSSSDYLDCHNSARTALICCIVFSLFCAPLRAAPQDSPDLRVTIVEADGAINNIRSARIHDPVVRVTDPGGRPVPGASVTFTLPVSGPSASFLDGQQTRIVQTDEDGRAVAVGLRPNKTEGPFEIRVLASSGGTVGRALVHMTNVDPNGETKSRRKLIIVAAIAGAVAATTLAAASGGGGSSSPAPISNQPGGTIIPGSPTVGPPR